MAAAITSNHLERENPLPYQLSTISTLEPNVSVAIPVKGPTGVAPTQVGYMVTTEPTDKQPVMMAFVSSDTAADTFTVRFHSAGDLTGAVVKVWAEYPHAASGGISA